MPSLALDRLLLSGLPHEHGLRTLLAEELANNRPMMAAVAAFARGEGVVYAEYAGLIYLSQSVQPVGSLPVSMGAPAPQLNAWHSGQPLAALIKHPSTANTYNGIVQCMTSMGRHY